LFSCTTFRQARLDLPPDERGMAELTALLELFKLRARTHKFEIAYDILGELESGLEDATTYTRSHPDFDDFAAVVERARPALDGLVERERRRQRAVAIAALDERLHATMARGVPLVAGFASHMPTAKDVDTLEEIVDELDEIEDDGEEYLDDSTWADALNRARPELAELRNKLEQAEWVRDLADDLERPLRSALTATPKKDVRHLESAVAELGRCAQRIESRRDDAGYTDDIPLETPLGRMPAEETALNCRLRMATAQKHLDTARWRLSVERALASLEEATRHLGTRGNTRIRLDGTQRAVAALESCHGALVGTERHAGFDSITSFATPLGRLNAPAIRYGCRQEANGLAPRIESLSWLVSLEGVASRAAEAHNHAMTATRDRRRALEHLSLAVGGFGECVERGSHLARAGARNPRTRVDSPFGRVTVRHLARLCGKRLRRVKKQLARVRRTQQRVAMRD
jgi:hypothetical protein